MQFAPIFLSILLSFLLSGCGDTSKTPEKTTSPTSTPTATDLTAKKVVVGTSPSIKDVLLVAKEDFDKDGYVMDLKIFDDYVTPNIALQEGSVDLNFYQHEPYLIQFNKSKGTNIEKYHTGIFKYYMGIFSNKVKMLADIPDKATVSIPNDASNRTRALKLLQSNGLISLRDDVALPTKLDITNNPKNLDIVEMDVMKLVSSLADVDASTINSIVATQGGVDPKSALAVEDGAESDKFSILIAVRQGQFDEQAADHLEKSLKTERVRQFFADKYKGAVIPLF